MAGSAVTAGTGTELAADATLAGGATSPTGFAAGGGVERDETGGGAAAEGGTALGGGAGAEPGDAGGVAAASGGAAGGGSLLTVVMLVMFAGLAIPGAGASCRLSDGKGESEAAVYILPGWTATVFTAFG
ncbi:MAG: hypothetical protein WA322_23620, partial [Pseudolabrys sp.]